MDIDDSLFLSGMFCMCALALFTTACSPWLTLLWLLSAALIGAGLFAYQYKELKRNGA
jgi:uncharacterized membrane protein SirB2